MSGTRLPEQMPVIARIVSVSNLPLDQAVQLIWDFFGIPTFALVSFHRNSEQEALAEHQLSNTAHVVVASAIVSDDDTLSK